jgi:peptide deformylase
MSVRDVVIFPDERLKAVCVPAAEAGVDVELLAADLLDTMRTFPGCVGIASPQIGVLARVAVVDVGGHKKAVSDHGQLVLIDPIVVEAHGSVLMREGCLSIPDFTGNVTRAERIVVEAGMDGSRTTYECDAYEARVILHELDHLDGVLFLDRVSSAKDIFPRKRYQ